MIHISSNFYLSGSPDLTGNPIIGYQSILTIDNVTADSSPTETPIINAVNEQTSQFWVSDSTDEQYIYFHNSGHEEIDYIGIAKPNFGTGQIEYQIQSSSDNSNWSDVTDSFIPSNDNAIVHLFDETTDEYLRLRLAPSLSVAPMAAHIKLGKALVMERCIRAPHSPITLSRSSDIINNTSENGSYLGRILKRQYLKSSYQFKNITPAFYRTYVVPFSIHAVTGAFFIAWKPIKYPNDVAYGWAANPDIAFQADNDNGMGSFDLDVKAVA